MIEYTWTPGQALSEISRVTKKGGKIVLSTDGPYCKWSFRRGSWQQIENTQDPIILILRMSMKGMKICRLIGLGNTFSTISSKNPLKSFIIRCGDKIVDLLYRLNIGWLFPNTLIVVAIKS
jgi:ubiquinone/menaquinone biosynthesis C-methylase UbiE